MPVRRRVLVLGDAARDRASCGIAVGATGFVVTGQGPLAEGPRLAGAFPADVIVITARRPIDVAPTIRELTSATDVPVVVLSASQSLYDVVSVARAGAMGYLSTRTSPEGLARALECVVSGEVVIPRALLTLLRDELRQHRVAGLPGGDDTQAALTPREREVLDLLRAGLTTREIAAHLAIAPVTVRTHIASIVRKLGVSNRESAVSHH